MKPRYKTYIYHATEEPKVVFEDEAQVYYDAGWADTPAKFIKLPDDPIEVQQLGEAIEGVKDSVNGALNLENMSKRELIAYGKKHFGAQLNKKDYKSTLIKTLKGLIGLKGN